jgi:hypothetical protein
MSFDDKLGSFRIGDKRRPEVRARGRGADKGPVEAPSSAGFPAIEQHLEGGSIEALAKLEALSAESKSMKDRAAAKKALAAYERTADLFEYLFATKSQLGSR